MYIERLRFIYPKLIKSHLTQTRNTDIYSIEYFESLLNESLPQSSAENEVRISIRKLYYLNKDLFLELIKNEPYYILMADVKDIVAHFKLNYVIFIRYQQTYKISLYLTKSIR